MKAAVSNLAWAGHDPTPYLELLSDCGVTGVEVAPTVALGEHFDIFGPLDDVRAYRNFLADYGLAATGLQSLYYGHPEFQFADAPSAAEALVVHSQRLVDVCVEFGGGYLLIGAPANRHLAGCSLVDAEKRAAENLHRIGEYASAAGVWFTVEALDSRFGCQLGRTLTEVARLIDLADSRGVRAHLDTGTTDPHAPNPFGPSEFGSMQVSARPGVALAADQNQYRWAAAMPADSPGGPVWRSLELPPPQQLTMAENCARITSGISQMEEVFH